MLLPVLAGLGALSLMSNPRRRRRRRVKVRRARRNPGPTAKDIRLLVLLQNELALAENRYEMRTHRSDARKLRREAVEARLRYRRFFRGMEAKTRSNPGRPVAKPTTERRAYQLGYAEGRDATGDLGRRGGWPAPEDISPSRAKDRLAIAWLRGNDAGLATARRSRSNPMRLVGARPAISRAKAKKIAAEYGVKLPSLGREVMLFKYGRFDTQVWLGNHSGTFVISDHGAIRDPITTEVATKLGIRTNPRRRGRRNPGTVSRTSLTDAEAAIRNKASLGSKRSGAWVMDHDNAKKIANQLRHGFKAVPSSHTGHTGKQLYLVTDGHWYVG